MKLAKQETPAYSVAIVIVITSISWLIILMLTPHWISDKRLFECDMISWDKRWDQLTAPKQTIWSDSPPSIPLCIELFWSSVFPFEGILSGSYGYQGSSSGFWLDSSSLSPLSSELAIIRAWYSRNSASQFDRGNISMSSQSSDSQSTSDWLSRISLLGIWLSVSLSLDWPICRWSPSDSSITSPPSSTGEGDPIVLVLGSCAWWRFRFLCVCCTKPSVEYPSNFSLWPPKLGFNEELRSLNRFRFTVAPGLEFSSQRCPFKRCKGYSNAQVWLPATRPTLWEVRFVITAIVTEIEIMLRWRAIEAEQLICHFPQSSNKQVLSLGSWCSLSAVAYEIINLLKVWRWQRTDEAPHGARPWAVWVVAQAMPSCMHLATATDATTQRLFCLAGWRFSFTLVPWNHLLHLFEQSSVNNESRRCLL